MYTSYQLENIYLKCDECHGCLIEVSDLREERHMVYKFFEYLKCDNCGKTFEGYEYEIDDDGNIINFKLKY